MQLRNLSAYGNITNYISTLDTRPTEKPDQPQKSLGEIAFISLKSKEEYLTTSKEEKTRWEKAVLYLLEQAIEKMTKVYPQHGDCSLGAHLYVALTSNDYLKWKKESSNSRQAYDLASHQALKAILVRAMTLQQERMNYLFENPSFVEKESPGQIAYATRFPDNPIKPRPSWEDAVQYLLYVWHQKITKSLRGFDDLPWSAHLYVGVTSSINYGYEAWSNEPTQVQEDYQVASTRVFNAVLLRVIPLQQQQVDGQPSPESFFPADS